MNDDELSASLSLCLSASLSLCLSVSVARGAHLAADNLAVRTGRQEQLRGKVVVVFDRHVERCQAVVVLCVGICAGIKQHRHNMPMPVLRRYVEREVPRLGVLRTQQRARRSGPARARATAPPHTPRPVLVRDAAPRTWQSAVPAILSSAATSSTLPQRTLLCILSVVASSTGILGLPVTCNRPRTLRSTALRATQPEGMGLYCVTHRD